MLAQMQASEVLREHSPNPEMLQHANLFVILDLDRTLLDTAQNGDLFLSVARRYGCFGTDSESVNVLQPGNAKDVIAELRNTIIEQQSPLFDDKQSMLNASENIINLGYRQKRGGFWPSIRVYRYHSTSLL